MQGFDYQVIQDVGLFTFYRQQAENEEILKMQRELKSLQEGQQKKQIQKKRKNKRKLLSQQRVETKPRQDKISPEKQSQSMQSTPMVRVPKIDCILKAKRYIKQLEVSGRSNSIYKYRQRKMKNNKSLQNEIINKNTAFESPLLSERDSDRLNQLIHKSQQIFAVRRDQYTKMSNYQFYQKQALAAKQFNSVELLKMRNDQSVDNIQLKRKMPNFVMLKEKYMSNPSSEVSSSKKLPRLNFEHLNSFVPNTYFNKKDQKPQLYNSIDILKNNKKYQIKQLQKIRRVVQAQTEINLQMMPPDNSVFIAIRKHRLVKQ